MKGYAIIIGALIGLMGGIYIRMYEVRAKIEILKARIEKLEQPK